jgi:multidrug resistance efflux pump
MQDLLQQIDQENYRAAQLLVARAEIAQLRRQASASVHTEQQSKIPTGASGPVEHRNPPR